MLLRVEGTLHRTKTRPLGTWKPFIFGAVIIWIASKILGLRLDCCHSNLESCLFCLDKGLVFTNLLNFYFWNDNCVQMTVRDALNSALDEEMSADPKVFLMGEEVRINGKKLLVFPKLDILSVLMFPLIFWECRLVNIKVHTRLDFINRRDEFCRFLLPFKARIWFYTLVYKSGLNLCFV